MFIGRKTELQFLENKYHSRGGQMIVLYGRRRVGKTETLKVFCKDKPHVFFACTECADKLQLKNFSEKILHEDIPASRYISQFEDWETAFRAVGDLPYEKKKLLIIDEFPYMCKNNSSIPSVLQKLWDEGLKDSNVMIILCGSSMSFIERELLGEKNPLYGRATGIYKMNPMGFYDAIQFFPQYSDYDKVLAYSILGGIPYYLSLFDENLSLEENIKQNILMKGCPLYSETDFLLRQELRETQLYNSLIQAIAMGSTRLNEISQKSLVENSSKTSVYLKNLIELGLVEREFLVSEKLKSQANISRGYYKLSDAFFRFWYAFAFSNYSDLEMGDVDGVYQYEIRPALHDFASFTFEEICRQFVRELQKRNSLPFRFSHMGRWFGKTTVRDSGNAEGHRVAETEIDILAISKDKKKYLVGECKFKKSPFSYSDYLDTVEKLAQQKKQAAFYYLLFSESGFEEKIREISADEDRVLTYSLEEIVNPDW